MRRRQFLGAIDRLQFKGAQVLEQVGLPADDPTPLLAQAAGRQITSPLEARS
jgi:hypothetical protein